MCATAPSFARAVSERAAADGGRRSRLRRLPGDQTARPRRRHGRARGRVGTRPASRPPARPPARPPLLRRVARCMRCCWHVAGAYTWSPVPPHDTWRVACIALRGAWCTHAACCMRCCWHCAAHPLAPSGVDATPVLPCDPPVVVRAAHVRHAWPQGRRDRRIPRAGLLPDIRTGRSVAPLGHSLLGVLLEYPHSCVAPSRTARRCNLLHCAGRRRRRLEREHRKPRAAKWQKEDVCLFVCF